MKTGRIIGFLVVIVLLAALAVYYPTIQKSLGLTGNVVSPQESLETGVLARVIDGDTIELGDGSTVRLLGINTPEKKMPLSNESKNFLNQFVNKTISLEKDQEDLDKYQRKLRYIYYENRSLNLEILESGLANSYYTKGLKYEYEVLNAEAQAKDLELGIWEKSIDICEPCLYLKELNFTEEYFILENNCVDNCTFDGWFVKDAGRNTFYLSNMSAGESRTYRSKTGTSVWNDDGDRFFIFDKKGKLVLFFEY
jgi:endonuclease YncB( thermonuclease family)